MSTVKFNKTCDTHRGHATGPVDALQVLFALVIVLTMAVNEVALLTWQIVTLRQRLLLNGLAFIIGLVSACRLAKVPLSGPVRRRLVLAAWVAMALPAWGFLCALANGYSLKACIATALTCNVEVIPAVLYCYRNHWARRVFVAYVVIQVVVGILIVAVPGSGLNFLGSASPQGGDEVKNLSMGDITSGEYRKLSAQFVNPVNLALYAGVDIAIAIGWLFRRSTLMKAVAVVLLAAGLFLLAHAFIRGIIIGLFLGIAVLVIRLHKGRKSWWPVVLCVAGIAAASIGISVASNSAISQIPVVQKMIQATDPGAEAYRIQALRDWPSHFVESPVFGAGGMPDFVALGGYYPHQWVLGMSLVFGLPGGLICGAISLAALAGMCSRRPTTLWQISKRSVVFDSVWQDEVTSVIAVCIILVLSLTNQGGGMYLGSTLWAFGLRRWAESATDTRSAARRKWRSKERWSRRFSRATPPIA